MSLISTATNSRRDTFHRWTELILVALVIARVAMGVVADRVGREGQVESASTIDSVVWDDRTGSPVVVTVRPEPRQAQIEQIVVQHRAAF
jgi:hypothetical protein